MKIGSIKDGLVIDHIVAGRGMEIYKLLELNELDCQVAIIMNAQSTKMGKKDIIKIDADVDIDTRILGYVDPGVTVDIIRDGVLVEKKKIDLPKELTNVIFCNNPRCITSTEQEIDHVFALTDNVRRTYRCIYCDTKAKMSQE